MLKFESTEARTFKRSWDRSGFTLHVLVHNHPVKKFALISPLPSPLPNSMFVSMSEYEQLSLFVVIAT